jgi:hypothetical protein
LKWNIPLKTAVGNGTFELSHRMATSRTDTRRMDKR